MIEKTPGVCGGVACIAGTRMPVWILVNLIKSAYPHLELSQMVAAFQYASEHSEEIAWDIINNDE